MDHAAEALGVLCPAQREEPRRVLRTCCKGMCVVAPSSAPCSAIELGAMQMQGARWLRLCLPVARQARQLSLAHDQGQRLKEANGATAPVAAWHAWVEVARRGGVRSTGAKSPLGPGELISIAYGGTRT